MENEKIDYTSENVVIPSPEEVLVNMRENMVPREEANKWQQKYYDLFQNVANGTFSGEDKAPAKSEKELKEDYENNLKDIANIDKHLRPLEIFQKLVDIDDYRINHGERSAFAPSEGKITDDIANSCDNMNQLLKSVIAQADNSDDVAVAYLGNHLIDNAGASIRSLMR